MCNCIETTNKALLGAIRERKTDSDIMEGYGIKNVTLALDAAEGSDPVRPYMDFHYKERRRKKDGSWGKETNRTSSVLAPFCPFCGKRYEDTKDREGS